LSMLISASVEFSHKAGDLINEIHRNSSLQITSKGKTDEGVNDPLTIADLRSHQLLVNSLSALIPRHRIHSEEKDSEDSAQSNGLKPSFSFLNGFDGVDSYRAPIDELDLWIDPLDATQEFTESVDMNNSEDKRKRLLDYVSVMICIARKGRPIGGVIHFPSSKQTVWGMIDVGSGGFNHAQEDKSKTMIVSRSHPGTVKELQSVLGMDRVVQAGGAGYKVTQLLMGNADLYVHRTRIKKWDFCAGDAVLRSAGGRMSDWWGSSFSYAQPINDDFINTRGLVASFSVPLHEEMIAKLENVPFEDEKH